MNAFLWPKNAWYVACRPEDIAGTLLGRTLCNERVVLFRDPEGRAAAVEDFCPHRGAPLSLGKVENGVLQCGYHGLRMGCAGRALGMPGQRVEPFPTIRTYPVFERYGFVWIWPGDPALADPAKMHHLPWAESDEWVYGGGLFRIGCDYRLMVDNLMDLTHETYVHASTIGQKEIDEAPVTTSVVGHEVITRRHMTNIHAPPFWRMALRGAGLPEDARVDRWQVCRFSLPSHVMIEVGVALEGKGGYDADAKDKASSIVVDFITPETETSHWYFWGMARNFSIHDQALTESIRQGQSKIFGEDREMLERQQQNLLRHPDRKLLKLNIDAGGVRSRLMIERAIASEPMTFSPLDSELLGPLFATDAMRGVFSDRARLSAMLRTEVALANASAHFGFAPPELAAAIAAIDVDSLDFAALGRETAPSGVLVVPFLRAVQKVLSPSLSSALHQGATTQDIVDSALVVQIRAALDLVAADLAAILADLSVLAATHRATPCVARTYGQHAAPTTFGFKVAVWLAGVTEVADRLAAVRARVLVASLGGPVGTLPAFGDKCANVLEAFAAELGLAAPPISWHTNRGRMAETGAWLAELLGALAKIATDVVLLGSTDIAEISEPYVPGRGGSSSMPHKRNPVSATVILAAHAASRGHLSTLMDAMAPAHERPAGLWHAEWLALPPLFGLVSGALREARSLAAGLVVHQDRMQATLAAARENLGPSFEPGPTLISASIWVDRALAEAARVRSSVTKG